SGQMANRMNRMIEQRPICRVGIAVVSLDKSNPRLIRPSRRGLPLQQRIVIVVEVVEHDEGLIGSSQQVLNEIAADETGAASDQNGHPRCSAPFRQKKHVILRPFPWADVALWLRANRTAGCSRRRSQASA